MTEPERLLDLGRGSCDRRLRLDWMLSRGDGASPTQLPVRRGGGRRFGDRAGGGRVSWYRATGSSSKSTAVGPDWARWGIGRTAAAMVAPRGAAAPGDQWLVASATSALAYTRERRSSGRWQHSLTSQGVRARARASVAAAKPSYFCRLAARNTLAGLVDAAKAAAVGLLRRCATRGALLLIAVIGVCSAVPRSCSATH